MVISRSILRGTLIFAVICSILSQFPSFVGTVTHELLKLGWLMPLGASLLYTPRGLYSRFLSPIYIFLICFFAYTLTLQAFTTKTYLSVDVKNVAICLMICAVSHAIWRKVGSQLFYNKIAYILLGLGIVFGIAIYSDTLSVVSLRDIEGIYSAKNSAAQILLNILIFSLGIQSENKWFKIIFFAVVPILLVEIFLMKSRATMVCALFAIAYLSVYAKNKNIKRFIRLMCLAGLSYLLYDMLHSNVIVETIFYANREAGNIDSLSSGRMSIIQNLWERYSQSPLLGVGYFYVDCFPIAMITQYGLVGLFIIIPFFVYLFKLIIVRIGTKKPLHLVTFLLFMTIMINSLFEAQPPFGPGVKCFIIWMAIGFSIADIESRNNKIMSNLQA